MYGDDDHYKDVAVGPEDPMLGEDEELGEDAELVGDELGRR